MRKRKNRFASIDLGGEEVKLLIVEKGLTGLKSLASERYPRHELANLAQAIQAYRPKEVILILPQERVIVRDLTIPPVDKSRVKAILEFELAGSLPYAMERVELDYLPLQKSGKELRVKAFVIPELLKKEIASLAEVGVTVTRVIPRGLAVTAYCQEKGMTNRLVKISHPAGDLVVYPDYKQYFSYFYANGQSVEVSELRQTLSAEGIEPLNWNLMDLGQSDVELTGAIQFHLKHRNFALLKGAEKLDTGLRWKVGIALTIVAILAVNTGTIYLDYTMKKTQLEAYESQLVRLVPHKEKVNTLKEDVVKIKGKYDTLQAVTAKELDYLPWLKELHLLLQEDTEVSILVFEGNLIRELHGKSPSATRVSERLAASPYFESPEFTSPITPKVDEAGNVQEEFSLTAVLTDPLGKGDVLNE